MNWIKFCGLNKIEVLEKFNYIGPLSKKQRENRWASFAYYSLKIKCPSDINLIGLRGKKFNDIICKIDGIYYDVQFSIETIRGLSDNRDHKIMKLEVEGLQIDQIKSKEIQRELKLSELFTL